MDIYSDLELMLLLYKWRPGNLAPKHSMVLWMPLRQVSRVAAILRPFPSRRALSITIQLPCT